MNFSRLMPADYARIREEDRMRSRAGMLDARKASLPIEEHLSHEGLEAALHLLRLHRHWTVADVVERHYGLK